MTGVNVLTKMLPVLFCAVFSVDQSKYRQCKDSVFCVRNRFVDKQQWSVVPSEISIEQNSFYVPLYDGTYKSSLGLNISFIPSQMIHIKVTSGSSESFERYDCSAEPTIVNSEMVNSPQEMEKEVTESKVILKHGNNRVEIQIAPFAIDYFNGDKKVLTLNPDDTAIFETNLKKEEYPEHWELATFGGYKETLKNGPASVAMSVKFYGSRTRLSGLPHHTLNLTLPSTIGGKQAISDPIRFYNTDINRFEIGSVMSMYASIPYLLAHDKMFSASLFWCNPSETWVDIDNEENMARFISETGFIDIFLSSGAHSEVIKSYTDLTGKPALPQLFALGYHQCRWTYYTAKEIRQVSQDLDRALIPHDAMWMDLDHTDGKRYFTFDKKSYGNVAKLVDDFMKQKRRVVAQVDPHLKVEKSYRVFSEANDEGYLLKDKNGEDYRGNCWPGTSSWVDFLDPDARKWWSGQYDFEKYKGSTRNLFTWNDMNEPAVFDVPDFSVPRDTQHYKGFEDRDVHNLYGHFMVMATYEGQMARNEKRDERPFILTRSLFSGSQKYAFMWTGDNTADWDQLRNSLAEVLNLGISGFPFSGADVGGFFDAPDSELLTRWYQLGAFCYPFFRCHCHHLSPKREPYTLPSGYQDAARKAIVERYALLPLWYTVSRKSFDTGEPVVRPLWWEFDDLAVQDMESEIMIGDSLLVAPVLDQGCKIHSVYLPKAAKWYDWRTMREVTEKGHMEILQDVMDNVPSYIRGGKIIFTKQTQRKSSSLMERDPYDVLIALDENQEATGTVYIDDGHTFNYSVNNEFIYRQITFKDNEIKPSDYVPIDKTTSFWDNQRSHVRSITIGGLAKKPSLVVDHTGREIEFTWDDGVLTLLMLKLQVKDDWTITLKE